MLKKEKKEIKDKIIEDRIIRDIRTLFEEEEKKKKRNQRKKKLKIESFKNNWRYQDIF